MCSDYQTSLTSVSARWTVEGDACPAERYEWAIERVDGHRVFDFYDTSGQSKPAFKATYHTRGVLFSSVDPV